MEALPLFSEKVGIIVARFREYGLCGDGSAYVLIQLFQKDGILSMNTLTVAW